MPLELNALETRILGCLLEKERLTPENYPLSLHSLTAACKLEIRFDPVILDSHLEFLVTTVLARHKETGIARDQHWRTANLRHLNYVLFEVADRSIFAAALRTRVAWFVPIVANGSFW